MNFYKRIGGLVAQIVLVIAAVIVFSYFDPFGWLSPGKKKLEDTPISVASVREIGQLVTAEYYGEVMSTLHDSLLVEFEAGETAAGDEFPNLNARFVDALRDFYHRRDSIRVRAFNRRNDLTDFFYSSYPSITNDIYYQDMMTVALEKKYVKRKHKDEADLLLDIWKTRNEREFEENFITPINNLLPAFTKARLEKRKAIERSKSFQKRQIIVLGRGVVRAGLDFGEFSEKNFKFDREKNIVFLFGVAPAILDCDINPWFIPERKVKGFEIIAATARANNPEDLLKVKGSCLTKLRTQAEAYGIVHQAKVNAEAALTAFFSLLLAEPVAGVKIMESSVEYYREMFPEDKVVPGERLLLMDSALLSLYEVSSDLAFQMGRKFSHLTWGLPPDTFRIHRYSYAAYRMAEDKMLTAEELDELKMIMRQRTYTVLDSLWFFPLDTVNTLKGRVRDQMLGKHGYTRGIALWYDSIRDNSSYKKFHEEDSIAFQATVLPFMDEKRKRAVAACINFLKENVKTIRREGLPPLNVETEIHLFLDTLVNPVEEGLLIARED